MKHRPSVVDSYGDPIELAVMPEHGLEACYRALASAVIHRAVIDCTVWMPRSGSTRGVASKRGDAGIHADIGLLDADSCTARAFLSAPNPCLEFWCAVGGLDMQAIVSGYHANLRAPWKVKRISAWHMRMARKRRREAGFDVDERGAEAAAP